MVRLDVSDPESGEPHPWVLIARGGQWLEVCGLYFYETGEEAKEAGYGMSRIIADGCGRKGGLAAALRAVRQHFDHYERTMRRDGPQVFSLDEDDEIVSWRRLTRTQARALLESKSSTEDNTAYRMSPWQIDLVVSMVRP
jgi:hypothetical protein